MSRPQGQGPSAPYANVTSELIDKYGDKLTPAQMQALIPMLRKSEQVLPPGLVPTEAKVGPAGIETTYGAPPTIGVSVRTDGTTRTFTETILKDVISKVFISGGTPSVLMVSPSLKQTVSGFTGLAAQRYQVPTNGQATILAGADLYQSDFGVLQIVPNRFMRTRDALILDPEYAALAYLRPFQTNDIAKVGDADKKQILAELTLEVRNEAAHGGAFDLSA